MTGESGSVDGLASTIRDLPRWLGRTSARRTVEWTLPRYVRHVDHHALDVAAAVDAIGTDGSLLFLCLGNVCRSPFAGRYAREAAATGAVTVESAGLSTTPGRSSPDLAVDAAAAHGVDLATHRAREADDDLVAAADAIFLMDPYNYFLYRRQFPEYLDRAVFLGAFESTDPAAAVAIDDPYGESAVAFEQAYDRIVTAVDELLARL